MRCRTVLALPMIMCLVVVSNPAVARAARIASAACRISAPSRLSWSLARGDSSPALTRPVEPMNPERARTFILCARLSWRIDAL
jgi:hypothetical protein